MLLASALFGLMLALPAGAVGLDLVDTLRDLIFLSGGTLHVASLGLFIGATSIAAARVNALPRWIVWLGIVASVLAILSLASLILYPASILIPLGRLLSLVWIIATSLVLAQNGAKVTVSGRDEAAINSVVQEIQDSGGEAIGVAADLTDFAAVERMRRRVEEELDPVEVLAVFAGGQGYPTPTEQMVEEQWRSVIDSDLTATFLTVRSFLPGMITMKSSAYRPTVYVGEAWLLRRWRKTQSRATVGAGGGLVATGCHIEGSC